MNSFLIWLVRKIVNRFEVMGIDKNHLLVDNCLVIYDAIDEIEWIVSRRIENEN